MAIPSIPLGFSLPNDYFSLLFWSVLGNPNHTRFTNTAWAPQD